MYCPKAAAGVSSRGMDIRGIAKEAGVSISTVSRVLNGTKRVSPDVAARVREIVERYEYAPDQSARSIALGRTNTVGLVIPAVSFSFFNSIFASVDRELSAAGYQVLTCTIRQTEEEELRYLDLLRRKRVDGIILMHESSEERIIARLRSSDVPLVLATIDTPELDVPSIGIDDYAAARDATERLLALGHRAIVFINGNGCGYSETRRLAGYSDAMAAAGSAPAQEIGDYSPDSGLSVARRILGTTPRPTAVFAANDEMAIGIMKAAEELGLSIPEELSVLGFDDIEISRFLRPSLSTVRQDVESTGKLAVETLLECLDGRRRIGRERIVVPHRVILRDSCARAPQSRP